MPYSGRLISGWSGDSFRRRQFSTSIPSTNRLGSNEGCETNARTSPVSGSSATSAPRRPSKACSASFCSSRSIDSMMSEPGTGSMRRKVRMGRPPAVTSTSSRPVRPCRAASQVFSMPFLPMTSVPR
ncbi:Uncharacterised protein [Bordetella pertussis]|nr:Uncharacterised protein [Bordetella pertussis]CFP56485.1 Uncharacterised protein [Bordetella pertussis]CFW05808.1 Uncharacterised protein [Bordetella pertussis]CFW34038.1 Uncharacterised protein [Bordetella pertussis]